MSSNFYGHNPNLKLPFIFDKTYPNFYEAIQEINLYDEDNNLRDPIYVGRYIFINYDLPPKTGGDNNDIFGGYPKIEWSEEKEEYAEILATGNNASLNNLIDTVAFDSDIDYHLSAWRKIIKYEDDNPKYDYEQIGSFNVTLPQINLVNKLIDPEEVIEETIDGEITPPEKGSTNQTYYLTIPIAKPWDIQLGDYDYHQDGFNPEENNYEEELSDFSLEEDLAKNYIRLETDSENPGVKFLKISLPAIGNTIAELFNLMYGKDRDQTNITWDFTYQSVIYKILSQE